MVIYKNRFEFIGGAYFVVEPDQKSMGKKVVRMATAALSLEVKHQDYPEIAAHLMTALSQKSIAKDAHKLVVFLTKRSGFCALLTTLEFSSSNYQLPTGEPFQDESISFERAIKEKL